MARNSRNSAGSKSPGQPVLRPGVAPPVHAPTHMVVQHQTQQYSGDIPHPDILEGFDRLVPGTAQRLIEAAMAETEHRRSIERKIHDGNIAAQATHVRIAEGQMKRIFRSDLVGQFLGFGISIAAIGAAVWLGLAGHEWLAAGTVAVPTAALIQAFRVNFGRRENSAPTPTEGK